MDALKFTSSIAVICVFMFVVTCIFLGIKGFVARGWDLNGWPKSSSDLSTSFAVFVLCFCSHVNTSKITSEIRFKKGKSKFPTRAHKTFRATIYAYIICALSYMFVGICGYAAFGDNIKDSILDNLLNILLFLYSFCINTLDVLISKIEYLYKNWASKDL